MHEPDTVFATAFYKSSWLGISGTRGFVYTLHRYMDPSGFKTQRSKAQECAFAVTDSAPELKDKAILFTVEALRMWAFK